MVSFLVSPYCIGGYLTLVIFAGSSLTGVTFFVVSLSRNINPSLVLVQPRKTRPFITERLLMGRKESNQTNNPCHADFFYEQHSSQNLYP